MASGAGEDPPCAGRDGAQGGRGGRGSAGRRRSGGGGGSEGRRRPGCQEQEGARQEGDAQAGRFGAGQRRRLGGLAVNGEAQRDDVDGFDGVAAASPRRLGLGRAVKGDAAARQGARSRRERLGKAASCGPAFAQRRRCAAIYDHSWTAGTEAHLAHLAGHARASPRLQPAEQSSSSRSSRRRPPPPSRAVSLPSSPRPSSSKHHDEPGRDVAPDIAPDSRLSVRQPSRSSRRRPRPSLAETPSRTPSPVRTPRSPGKSPSPSLDPAAAGKSAAPAAELLGAAADAGLAAVEQVGEAVSSALSRVGAFFGSGARTRQV